MADFAALAEQVARIQGVVPSAVALIRGFKTQLDAAIAEAVAANDDADLTAITDFSASIGTEVNTLADAVAEHAPAPPA